VYFVTGADTALTSAEDNVSVIHLANSLSPGLLAETIMYPTSVVICFDNNGYKHVFPKEIDIAFWRNPPQPWYFDTLGALPAGMRDFYEIALHEVGHGNLVQHVTAPTVAGNATELMFWTGLVGPVAEINRRWIDVQAAIGGFDVVQISEALNINFFDSCNTANAGTLILSPDLSCGQLLGFEEIRSNESDVEFKIYPNPATNQFNISGIVEYPAEISLYDLTGSQVLSRIIYNNEPVQVNNFPPGLYLYQVKTPDVLVRGKLVKQ
jgi:hypothetical protein